MPIGKTARSESATPPPKTASKKYNTTMLPNAAKVVNRPSPARCVSHKEKLHAKNAETTEKAKGLKKIFQSDGTRQSRSAKMRLHKTTIKLQKKLLIGAPKIPMRGFPIKKYATMILTTDPASKERMGRLTER